MTTLPSPTSEQPAEDRTEPDHDDLALAGVPRREHVAQQPAGRVDRADRAEQPVDDHQREVHDQHHAQVEEQRELQHRPRADLAHHDARAACRPAARSRSDVVPVSGWCGGRGGVLCRLGHLLEGFYGSGRAGASTLRGITYGTAPRGRRAPARATVRPPRGRPGPAIHDAVPTSSSIRSPPTPIPAPARAMSASVAGRGRVTRSQPPVTMREHACDDDQRDTGRQGASRDYRPLHGRRAGDPDPRSSATSAGSSWSRRSAPPSTGSARSCWAPRSRPAGCRTPRWRWCSPPCSPGWRSPRSSSASVGDRIGRRRSYTVLLVAAGRLGGGVRADRLVRGL